MGAIEDANIVKDMEARFKASLDDLSEKLSSVRTGRANAKVGDAFQYETRSVFSFF
jgi:ribosome recycling factor